jgi:hypothetical protein
MSRHLQSRVQTGFGFPRAPLRLIANHKWYGRVRSQLSQGIIQMAVGRLKDGY